MNRNQRDTTDTTNTTVTTIQTDLVVASANKELEEEIAAELNENYDEVSLAKVIAANDRSE